MEKKSYQQNFAKGLNVNFKPWLREPNKNTSRLVFWGQQVMSFVLVSYPKYKTQVKCPRLTRQKLDHYCKRERYRYM